MKLHRVDVWNGEIMVWSSVGDAVDVDGTRMVRLPHGTIVPSDGFHETASQSKRAGADAIDKLRAELAAKAAALRAEADGLELKGS